MHCNELLLFLPYDTKILNGIGSKQTVKVHFQNNPAFSYFLPPVLLLFGSNISFPQAPNLSIFLPLIWPINQNGQKSVIIDADISFVDLSGCHDLTELIINHSAAFIQTKQELENPGSCLKKRQFLLQSTCRSKFFKIKSQGNQPLGILHWEEVPAGKLESSPFEI